MNWYKKAQNISSVTWNDEERDFLENTLERLHNLQRDNVNAKIQVDGAITASSAHFKVSSRLAVSTQLESFNDESTDSINIEKTEENYYEVSINNSKWVGIDNFAMFKRVVDSFSP